MDGFTLNIVLAGVAVLSFISGMLGLGAAFATIPYLSLFMSDLVHQVQPVALLLNGFTSLFAMVGFARSGLIRWRDAAVLAAATTLSAPLGSLLAQYTPQMYIWLIYFAAVLYLAYSMFKGASETPRGGPNLKLATALAVPISILAGLLGVGPGFLLMPTLILLGYEPRLAAGINALAVCPPSFSAFIPHIPTMRIDPLFLLAVVAVGSAAAYAGARATVRYVKGKTLRQIFGLVIVIMTLYKIMTLL